MESLKNINDNSLIICTNQDKLQILNYLSNNSIFLNLKFYNPNSNFDLFSKEYPFFMTNNFQISPNLSEKIKKYFDYIEVDDSYDNQKIEELRKIKINLLRNAIIVKSTLSYQDVYSINDILIPSFIKGQVNNISLFEKPEEVISIYKTKDQSEQVFFVYQRIVEMLEKGISINKINILNSSEEDDLQFSKIFNDARINYNINKRQAIFDYQITTNLIKILKTQSYEDGLSFLEQLETSIIQKKLIRLFNSYESKLVRENIDTFIYELKKVSMIPNGLIEAINISEFNNVLVNDDEYYILMNYYDEVFPKKYLDNDYLSDDEAKELRYPSSLDFNKQARLIVKNKIEQMKNIIICYPKIVIDETIKSRINLDRKVIEKLYQKELKKFSYLPNLDYLEFSKKIYDYRNYRIVSDNLQLLNNTFGNKHSLYIPQFTGINKNTLDILIKKNNTLSGSKIETYNLCPFRYFLTSLLKLDSFNDNIYTFIGNVIHKALELRLKSNNIDIEKILLTFNFPESEKHKFKLFSEIVKENVEMIMSVVNDFEKLSQFNKIYTETKIDLEFDNTFNLIGYIDKVMVDEETNYYLIVDYKYSDKDYSLEEFNKGYKLQLPIYLYAWKKMFPEQLPAGMLYQKTSLEKKDRDQSSDYRMKGIVLDDDKIIKRIDPTVSSIKGLKSKKDKSISKTASSIIDLVEIENLQKKTYNYIKMAAKSIKSGDFIIKPIITEFSPRSQDSISCEFCPFFNICFSKNKILGGENL
jgi:ATP-dependent helicase/DNAse subunit B